MQFPVLTKFNPEMKMICVSGSGNVLKLAMFPPEANFEYIQPYNGISTMQVLLSNPTKHPIEVFSRQFDLTLVTDRAARLLSGTPLSKSRPQTAANKAEKTEEMISFNENQNNDSTKTKVCIIINGPPKSGCTIVSKMLSEEFGNIPVVNLYDVWGNLQPDASFEEMMEKFRISKRTVFRRCEQFGIPKIIEGKKAE